MDNRWVWILLFCLAITLAIWELKETSDNRTELNLAVPTLTNGYQGVRLSTSLFTPEDTVAVTASSRERAVELALRKAYPKVKSWADRQVDVQWTPVRMEATSGQQILLSATAMPEDGLVALFNTNEQGQYLLRGLVSDLSHIEWVKASQLTSDGPEELIVVHNYDEMVGGFFRITTMSVLKWSNDKKSLVCVWDHPLDLEQYDPDSGFQNKQTKRSQITTGPDHISVYEVTTNWVLNSETQDYQAVSTETEHKTFTWQPEAFAFGSPDA